MRMHDGDRGEAVAIPTTPVFGHRTMMVRKYGSRRWAVVWWNGNSVFLIDIPVPIAMTCRRRGGLEIGHAHFNMFAAWLGRVPTIVHIRDGVTATPLPTSKTTFLPSGLQVMIQLGTGANSGILSIQNTAMRSSGPSAGTMVRGSGRGHVARNVCLVLRVDDTADTGSGRPVKATRLIGRQFALHTRSGGRGFAAAALVAAPLN